MKENAHCPRPEKLSSLAFFFGLSMNSLFVCAPASSLGPPGFRGTVLGWAGPEPEPSGVLLVLGSGRRRQGGCPCGGHSDL